MLWSVTRLIFKTSSVTPDFVYVFNLILSLSSPAVKDFKNSVRRKFRTRTSLRSIEILEISCWNRESCKFMLLH